MPSRYPSFNDYQAALQNPGVYFNQPILRGSQPELDLWGLPRVRSGGFALTYRMTSRDGQDLAVRCFHKPVEDRTQRYAAIHEYLLKVREPFFLPVHYLAKGITLKQQTYPITYMDWVNGDTLEAWLYSSLDDQQGIHDLSLELVALAARLGALGVAHGDLSHRNIMVRDRKLVLVDYWAEWCGPCKMIAPILDEVSVAYEGKVQIAKMNVDENRDIPAKFGIRGIPTLMLFKNGQLAATKVGAMSKAQLTAFIDQQLV